MVVAILAWYDYKYVLGPLERAHAAQLTKPALAQHQQQVLNRTFLAVYHPYLPIHLAKVLKQYSDKQVHSSTQLMLNGWLLKLQTSTEEQLALVLQQGYFGEDAYGISSASLAHFQKPLSSCDEYELAMVLRGLRAVGFSDTEKREFDAQAECLADLKSRDMPRVPAKLLLRGNSELGESTEFQVLSRELAAQWPSLVPGMLSLRVEGAGHYIQKERPQLVADEIRSLVDGIQSKRR